MKAACRASRSNRRRVAGVKWRASWKQASSTVGSVMSRPLYSRCLLIGSSSRLVALAGTRCAVTTSNGVEPPVGYALPSSLIVPRGAGRSDGSAPGRPYSQPWPTVAPSARAVSVWSGVSMPSARIVAPVRSACAATALTMLATSVVVRPWISRRSSLITSGLTNGITARLAGSAPTSSSAMPQPTPL